MQMYTVFIELTQINASINGWGIWKIQNELFPILEDGGRAKLKRTEQKAFFFFF